MLSNSNFIIFSGPSPLFWFANMLHLHVILSADSLPCDADCLVVPIAASPDRFAPALVHLCPSASPQYLAGERGQRPAANDNDDGEK